jgi:hypothetical protein
LLQPQAEACGVAFDKLRTAVASSIFVAPQATYQKAKGLVEHVRVFVAQVVHAIDNAPVVSVPDLA